MYEQKEFKIYYMRVFMKSEIFAKVINQNLCLTSILFRSLMVQKGRNYHSGQKVEGLEVDLKSNIVCLLV